MAYSGISLLLDRSQLGETAHETLEYTTSYFKVRALRELQP